MLTRFYPRKGPELAIRGLAGNTNVATRRLAKMATATPVFPVREIGVTLCLALTLAALPGLSRAGFVDSPVCRAHLDKIEVQLSRATSTLAQSDDECAAMHGRVRTLLAARNVYKRCATGDERIIQVGLMEGSIDQFADRITTNCTSQ